MTPIIAAGLVVVWTVGIVVLTRRALTKRDADFAQLQRAYILAAQVAEEERTKLARTFYGAACARCATRFRTMEKRTRPHLARSDDGAK